MNVLKRNLLKLLPYIGAVITGIIFYILSVSVFTKLEDLFVNIAATFFAIPLLFFFYEIVRSFSNKKLNSEIFDYAKMQVDRELLSIINQLQKIIYTLEEKDFSDKGINELLSIKKDDLTTQISENKYLGFQVFKHWEESENNIQELLKSSFILERIEDEQIISILNILKSLKMLESLKEVNDLYIETEERAEGFKIESGVNINPENNRFPDRHILLKYLTKDKFIVYDFGDIHRYNLEKCLKYYKVNSNLSHYYAEVLFELLSCIKNWVELTGFEFVIDSKVFKHTYVKR